MSDVLPRIVGLELGSRSHFTHNVIAWTTLALWVGIVAEDRLLNSTADAVKFLLWCFIHPKRKFSVLTALKIEAVGTGC